MEAGKKRDRGDSMAILVTGGAGYIGSVTVDYLLSLGEKTVVLDDLKRGHREALPPSVPFYQGDIGDEELLARIAREHELKSCIHFAALAYVGESVKEPRLYFQNNVQKGITLIGALLEAGVRRFVFSSSCATYGNPEKLPVKEDCRQQPTSPYGWSKLILEQVLNAYDVAYGLRSVCLRYFNAAGATEKLGEDHEPETHLIANVLQAASGRLKELPVFGNDYKTPDGTTVRDYVHVSDLAEAHALSLEHLRRGGDSQVLNLGSAKGYSVLEVIESARQVTGRSIRFRVEEPRAGDAGELVADATKAQRILGWTPRRSELTTILRSAWEWHQRYPNGYAKG
jgi:UDP-glucose 4-epimerase